MLACYLARVLVASQFVWMVNTVKEKGSDCVDEHHEKMNEEDYNERLIEDSHIFQKMRPEPTRCLPQFGF